MDNRLIFLYFRWIAQGAYSSVLGASVRTTVRLRFVRFGMFVRFLRFSPFKPPKPYQPYKPSNAEWCGYVPGKGEFASRSGVTEKEDRSVHID